jgi:membrane protein
MSIALLKKINSEYSHWLWAPGKKEQNFLARALITVLRYLTALIRDIGKGQITLHAVSLVYTILLSLVPVLALCFSILKGLDVHRNQEVINLIEQFLQPLGPKSSEITQRMLEFVENIRGDLLGLFGVLFLFLTAIILIRKVETSFNSIWEIENNKNFGKRLTEYVGALVIAPVLMLSALALGTTISSHHLTQQVSQIEAIGFLVQNFGKLVPTLLVICTFSFLYMFIPNTRVKFKHALLGGTLTGITWSFVGFLFATIVAGSTRYTAIYSSFAILIIFMIWLYISCLILLIGARLVFYLSHSQHLRHGTVQVNLSPMQELSFGCEIMLQVSKDFETGSQKWNTDSLSRFYQLPSNNISKLLTRMETSELLRKDENGYLFPGRQPGKINLSQVAEALFSTSSWRGEHRFNPQLKNLLVDTESSLLEELSNHSLDSLLAQNSGIKTN